MAKEFPAATTDFERDGEAIVAPPSRVHAVIGCCTSGPSGPFQFDDPETLAAARGAGPAVKAAAYSIARGGAPVIFQRVPASARAAYVSPVDTSQVEGTARPTATGTPIDGVDVVLTIVNGGTIGTTGVTYTLSLDGGWTTGTTTALGTATTVALPGTGLTISLTAAQTFVTGDVVRFYALPASAAILAQKLTRAPADVASTAEPELTGTPVDAYEVLVEVVTGGTVGTKGISVRYSLDGGRTYAGTFALVTDEELELMDGDVPSGLILELGTGTLNAGDKLEASTTAPEPSAAAVVAAIQALDASQHAWSFLHIIGEQRPADAADIGAALGSLATSTNGDETYTVACLSARDRTAAEDDLAWSQRLVDDFGTLEDSRLAIGAGMARITCPITGRRNRRPAMWPTVARIVSIGIEEDAGKMALGPLFSDVAIYGSDKTAEEHDAMMNPLLHQNRFTTLRSRKRRGGVYVTEGAVFGAQGSLVQRFAQRRVLDLCAEIARQQTEEFLQGDYLPSPDGTGRLDPSDAADLDLQINTAIQAELGAAIAGVTAQVDRNAPVLVTGELPTKVKVNGRVYIRKVRTRIGYARPTAAATV